VIDERLMPADPTAPGEAPLRLVVLMPVFNDWSAVELLLPRLDEALAGRPGSIEVLLLDDGSLVSHEAFHSPALATIRRVSVLELRRNLGHQRAIAIGLAYVYEHLPCDAVLVMDGDGEDNPADAPRLLQEAQTRGWRPLVFAARARRSEGWLFQACYRVYQVLHWVLTGYRVRVGNFSVIPASALGRLVVVSELWNHYAAAVFNARIEYTTVPTVRSPRLAGETRMNFTALVVHGLSALSVYSQIIGVRLLIASLVVAGALLVGFIAVGAWLNASGDDRSLGPLLLITVLLILLLQAVVSGVAFVFLVLSGRQAAAFIPLRDYRWFVGRQITVWSKPGGQPQQ
jgi:glycosyltransferase involved in cell wall biosynthesis